MLEYGYICAHLCVYFDMMVKNLYNAFAIILVLFLNNVCVGEAVSVNGQIFLKDDVSLHLLCQKMKGLLFLNLFFSQLDLYSISKRTFIELLLILDIIL